MARIDVSGSAMITAPQNGWRLATSVAAAITSADTSTLAIKSAFIYEA